MPGAVPCNWLQCLKRCLFPLACGHQCPSLCGEICPGNEFCQQCASAKIKHTIVDFIEGNVYKDINLDLDPCIFPVCRHLLTKANMDGVLDAEKHYDFDGMGDIVSLKLSSEPFSSKALEVCPSCRGTLSQISRYARIVRRVILDESTKGFTISAHTECASKEQDLASAEDIMASFVKSEPLRSSLTLQAAPQSQIRASIAALCLEGKYKKVAQMYNSIQQYLDRVKKEEQPYHHVQNL